MLSYAFTLLLYRFHMLLYHFRMLSYTFISFNNAFISFYLFLHVLEAKVSQQQEARCSAVYRLFLRKPVKRRLSFWWKTFILIGRDGNPRKRSLEANRLSVKMNNRAFSLSILLVYIKQKWNMDVGGDWHNIGGIDITHTQVDILQLKRCEAWFFFTIYQDSKKVRRAWQVMDCHFPSKVGQLTDGWWQGLWIVRFQDGAAIALCVDYHSTF